MCGIRVQEDQTGNSTRVFGSVDPRKGSSNRVADEEEFGLGRELLKYRIEVSGDLNEIVAEWTYICGIRVES